MRLSKNKQGYTIVEVMLFVAISGFMFVIAAISISGKQDKAEFRQGMNATNDQIRQTINDISNGYFPSSGNQGAHLNDVFEGKIIQFNTNDTTIYVVKGRQFTDINDISSVPKSIDQAVPSVDSQTNQKYEWGLQFVKGWDNIPSAKSQQIDSIAFIKSFAGAATAGEGQSVTATTIPTGTGNKVGYVTAKGTPPSAPPSTVNSTLCFSDGGKQFGSVTVGGSSGQRLTSKIKIGNSLAEVGC